MMYQMGPMGPVQGNYFPSPGINGHHQRGFDETSAVNHLRKNQLANEENFIEKIKEWETSTQQK